MNPKILIFYKTTPEIEKAVKLISKEIKSDLFPDQKQKALPLKKQYDLIIAIGGDGTVLHAETIFPHIPKLPLGAGRIEFLSSAPLLEWKTVWQLCQQGKYYLESRSKIRWHQFEALNEINFSKKDLGQMFEGEIYLDDKYVYTIRGDGVIIATPTGSTAYALSAGGSIINPQIEAVAIVPVAPFKSFIKPLVVPLTTKIKVKTLTPSIITIDGSTISSHQNPSEFVIEKGLSLTQFVRFKDYPSFYDKLQLFG